MNCHSLYDQCFARVAAVTLPVHPARPFENAREIIDAARERDRNLAWQALALHPLVDSVNVARDVLDQAIRTNPLVAAAFD